MRVSCGACHTTYRVSVEVPEGRTLRGRCKRCNTEIRVGADATPTPSLRSLAPTLPAPAAAADTEATSLRGDETSSSRSREAWCVDRGQAIDMMSTFELWVAIAAGQVNRGSRVWREGMECWTPVERIPEVACALVDVYERELPGPGAPPAVEASRPSVDPGELVARLGTDPLAALDAAAGDTPMSSSVDVPTLISPPPSPELLPQREEAAKALRAPRPPAARLARLVRRSAGLRDGGRWVALGSAVALGALGLAGSGLANAGSAARPALEPPACETPEHASHPVPPAPAGGEGPSDAPPTASAAVDLEVDGDRVAQASVAAPPRSAKRPVHVEAGQRRLRRGPRR